MQKKVKLDCMTELVAEHIRNGKVIDTRVVKDKVVTNAFVYDIVASLIGTTGHFDKFRLYKWHDSGISTVAESATQTALLSRVSTDRVSGTQVNSGSSNAYRSVATKTFSSTKSVTEHGLFNSSSTAVAATTHLMDRTKFAAINVINGDSIQYTFTITFTAGG